ncbi:class I fructose-bisphosphate aldolase [Marinobacter confluentis]|uniref:Probable fructose-bisphosphate aldolase class 1 n=1 Tax=Marinobacter confluentis TaxID=1697557 RepID=A0A4Z1CCM5_9GAMM|nr:class I fructose-bisphosphate aldolase [Marinobacter confluentis]TGN41873.1 fructose-bisphosphate aldolase class I [Marinobacter confluentis]
MTVQEELQATIRELVQPGKGVLAADESNPTIAKRFTAVGVESTEAMRQQYRSIIFSAPGLNEHISGVILFEETLEQKNLDGIPMPELLASQGIVPGIKVDKGKGPLANAPDEEIIFGLDGLEARLSAARELGARFAKWRCVFHISDTLPSELAIGANAETLARYAAICQSLGIVPIVEPEVLIDGAHSIERSAEVGEQVIRGVFRALDLHRVNLETMILKPSMITPGKDSPKASPEQVAAMTIRTYRRCVPAAVPGIFFLSGGQTPEEATLNLNAMNQHADLPWTMSFSYGRALQEPAQHAWKGELANRGAAHKAMTKRARLNGAAALGSYSSDMENQG